MSNIPHEFADYLTSKVPLNADEQIERLNTMRADEIIYRARLMANLAFDKDEAKSRIKENYNWAYEFGEMPSFYKSIDTLVDDVYSQTRK